MKIFRLKYKDDNTSIERIIPSSSLRIVGKYGPDKLNPQIPYGVSFGLGGYSCSLDFPDKLSADNYFNYVMEKLRSIELKNMPW